MLQQPTDLASDSFFKSVSSSFTEADIERLREEAEKRRAETTSYAKVVSHQCAAASKSARDSATAIKRD